ncbi:MAG: branched-chain amino acid ABC transporter permease [Dehalococcoidia bacterium]|nr:branched-chain amino acid ABC transporter permease [Dehalococcoidia bacterium]
MILIPVFFANQYYLSLMTTTCFTILFAASLRFGMRANLLNFGLGGFIGIGGYTWAVLSTRWGLSFELSLLIAIALTAIVSIVVGVLLLRVRGIYYLMLTFAFAQLLILMWTGFEKPFGGSVGLFRLPNPSILGLELHTKIDLYLMAFVLMLVSLLVMWRLECSKFGLVCNAMRQSEDQVEAIGLNTRNYKVMCFVISCIFAAMGGVFYIAYLKNIEPGYFSVWRTVFFMTVIVLGGLGNIWGVVIGASCLAVLSEYMWRGMEYQEFIYGGLLILLVLLLPGGLVSLPKLVWRRLAGQPLQIIRRGRI